MTNLNGAPRNADPGGAPLTGGRMTVRPGAGEHINLH
jgi:hypothetical protein